ncbi:centromere-associated protein E-like [Saccostrea cucullata]|uniref:centromere-associated protein E-like n=1 Tax=Saccostrea cuccullata TaxID=36930 RepID=UPI002ECFF9DD
MEGKWTISENFLIQQTENGEKKTKIKNVRAGAILNRIDIVLESNETISLNLKDVYSAKGDIKEETRSSRSKFLEWWKETQESVECLEKGDPKIEEEVQNTDKEEQGHEENETVVEQKSIDKEVIKKHLIGSRVQVHISNLVPPAEGNMVRALDNDHVDKICQQLKLAHGHYTTLIGVLKEGRNNISNIDDLKNPNVEKIEVIGGNHTREALQQLHRDGDIDQQFCVLMDIYQNLSQGQVFHLGYLHNEMHESSKKMSFPEKVILFRKLRETNETSNKTAKQNAAIWRGRVATITNKTKNEIKNCFRVHLNLASLPEDLWKELVKVFNASQERRLKGVKSTDDLSQYHFFHFSKVKTVEEKKTLLSELAEGNITLEEFRERTLRPRQKTGKKSAEPTTENKVDNTVSASNEDKKDLSDSEHIDEESKEDEKIKRQVLELRQQMKESEEKIKEAEKKISTYSELVLKQKEELDQLKEKIHEQEIEILNLRKSEENLQNQVTSEREKCMLAEDAAARARSKFSDKCDNKKKSEKRPADEDLNLKVSENQKRTKLTKNDHSLPKDELKNKVTVVAVDFNEKVYLGMIDKTNNITFAKKPIGKISQTLTTMDIKDICLTLNTKDVMQMDKKFIICSSKSVLEDDKLVLTKKEIQSMITSVTEYGMEKKSNK